MIGDMNRRQFLASLGIGAPAAVLEAKLGLVERVRKYFFAPKCGWKPEDLYLASMRLTAASPRSGVIITGLRSPEILAIMLDEYSSHIAEAMRTDSILFDKFDQLAIDQQISEKELLLC